MIERIRFLLKKHPFVYHRDTGGGMAVQGYNPFTDEVTIRHSLRGYVTTVQKYTREQYLAKIADPEWEKRE